jgi:hypothetical protein
MKFLLRHKVIILGGVIGAIIGYSYYFFIGCKSGTCLITGRPMNSSIYGAVMGMLAINIFSNNKKKGEDKTR